MHKFTENILVKAVINQLDLEKPAVIYYLFLKHNLCTPLYLRPHPLHSKPSRKMKLKGIQRIYLKNYLKNYKTKNVILNLKNAKK